MQAGVGAVICSVVYDMSKDVIKTRNWMNNAIMMIAFVVTCFFNVNVIYVILICIAIGIVRTFLS